MPSKNSGRTCSILFPSRELQKQVPNQLQVWASTMYHGFSMTSLCDQCVVLQYTVQNVQMNRGAWKSFKQASRQSRDVAVAQVPKIDKNGQYVSKPPDLDPFCDGPCLSDCFYLASILSQSSEYRSTNAKACHINLQLPQRRKTLEESSR
jgi:hypothetical protein